eukprot:scpid65735/ scgid3846/ 
MASPDWERFGGGSGNSKGRLHNYNVPASGGAQLPMLPRGEVTTTTGVRDYNEGSDSGWQEENVIEGPGAVATGQEARRIASLGIRELRQHPVLQEYGVSQRRLKQPTNIDGDTTTHAIPTANPHIRPTNTTTIRSSTREAVNSATPDVQRQQMQYCSAGSDPDLPVVHNSEAQPAAAQAQAQAPGHANNRVCSRLCKYGMYGVILLVIVLCVMTWLGGSPRPGLGTSTVSIRIPDESARSQDKATPRRKKQARAPRPPPVPDSKAEEQRNPVWTNAGHFPAWIKRPLGRPCARKGYLYVGIEDNMGARKIVTAPLGDLSPTSFEQTNVRVYVTGLPDKIDLLPYNDDIIVFEYHAEEAYVKVCNMSLHSESKVRTVHTLTRVTAVPSFGIVDGLAVLIKREDDDAGVTVTRLWYVSLAEIGGPWTKLAAALPSVVEHTPVHWYGRRVAVVAGRDQHYDKEPLLTYPAARLKSNSTAAGRVGTWTDEHGIDIPRVLGYPGSTVANGTLYIAGGYIVRESGVKGADAVLDANTTEDTEADTNGTETTSGGGGSSVGAEPANTFACRVGNTGSSCPFLAPLVFPRTHHSLVYDEANACLLAVGGVWRQMDGKLRDERTVEKMCL